MKLTGLAGAVVMSALCIGGPAGAEGLEGYMAEIDLTQGGRTVAHMLVPMTADGVLEAGYDDHLPYRRSVAVDQERHTTTRVQGRVTTGLKVSLRCERSGTDLRVAAKADLDELVGLVPYATGGETIDLPNLNHFALRHEVTSTQRDGGWQVDVNDPAQGLAMRVDIKPRKS